MCGEQLQSARRANLQQLIWDEERLDTQAGVDGDGDEGWWNRCFLNPKILPDFHLHRVCLLLQTSWSIINASDARPPTHTPFSITLLFTLLLLPVCSIQRNETVTDGSVGSTILQNLLCQASQVCDVLLCLWRFQETDTDWVKYPLKAFLLLL